MTITLPPPVAGYFAADRGTDASAVARLFTEHAVVRDEGQTHAGREAIRQWKAGSSSRYTYTVEPIAVADEAGLTVVTAHLDGNFPGSPVDLHYRFALEGEQIAGLEVVP